jgi:hypothetical protein
MARKKAFSAKVRIIGINPYVQVPKAVLQKLFDEAGRDRGPIPVCGTLNGKKFQQTLVRFQGAWRLYLNTPMRRDAGIDVGDQAVVELGFDPKPRTLPIHPHFALALEKNKAAKAAFERLAPSRRKEILRYLGFMKTEISLRRNIAIIVDYLSGRKPAGLHALLRLKA